MRLSIISILLVFISAACAIPLGAIASNKDIQPISKRTEPVPRTMAELMSQLNLLNFNYSDLEMFWKHHLGVKIAGTEGDPVHILRDWGAERNIIKAIISDHITDEEIIHNVLYILKMGMRLRAFAKHYNPPPGSPRYVMVIADDGYHAAFDPDDLPKGINKAKVFSLRKDAKKGLDHLGLAFPTQNNYLLRPTKNNPNRLTKNPNEPWEIVFI